MELPPLAARRMRGGANLTANPGDGVVAEQL